MRCEAMRAALIRGDNRSARFTVLPEGGHSPHSERATADEVTRLAASFLRGAAAASVDARVEGARS